MIWLAESVEASQIVSRRRQGLYAASDCQMYEVFDITYDYDIWLTWRAVLKNQMAVSDYLDLLLLQDAIYPHNFIKMRMVGNHDQERIAKAADSPEIARAWTAFQAFNRGAFLIYAGQEFGATQTPSLFDVDKIELSATHPNSSFIAKLAELKKHPIVMGGATAGVTGGCFSILSAEPTIQAGLGVRRRNPLWSVQCL